MRERLPIYLILLVVFAVFLPTLKNGFVWDDYHNFVNNFNYRGLSPSNLHWMVTTFHDANYHPLCWLTLGLDFVLWGMNPAGYHLTNLILHGLNAVLFYFLIKAFLQRSSRVSRLADSFGVSVSAIVGALFFAVHPLRVEPVACISARGDVLAGFFYLLTIIAYLRMNDKQQIGDKRKWFFYCLIFYVFSLLSRAWGITMPLVLLILDVYPLRRFGWRNWSAASHEKVLIEKIPFLVLALSAGILAFLAKKPSMLPVAEYDIINRFIQATYGLCFYLWKTVLPVRLSPLYLLDKTFNPMEGKYILCGLLAIGITVWLIFRRHRWPGGITAWGCYVVIVSPLLGFVQSGPQIVADRYTYFSCLPFGVLVGAGILSLWVAWSEKRLSAVVGGMTVSAVGAGLIILSVFSFRQSMIWHDSNTVWSRVLQIDPANYIAFTNRGVFRFEREGDLAGALADYNAAIRLNPKDAGNYYNRGILLEKQGDIAGALADYSAVIRLAPKNSRAYNNRGGLRKETGDIAGAVEDFNTAIRLNPFSPEPYANRGVIRLNQDDLKGAVHDFNKALEVASDGWPYRVYVEQILAGIHARINEEDKRRAY